MLKHYLARGYNTHTEESESPVFPLTWLFGPKQDAALEEAKQTYGTAYRYGNEIIVKKDGQLLPLKDFQGNEMWGGFSVPEGAREKLPGGPTQQVDDLDF